MTVRDRAFEQVDVFSITPFLGNPVAVVLDAVNLTDAQMQRLASWTNLSETTFVLPATTPEADYRLRIFTPGGELPFAGHPTLGSAHAWLNNGGSPKSAGVLVQECGAGLVKINHDAGTGELAFQAPATLRSGPIESNLLDEIAEALGLSVNDFVAHQWVDNGPGWVCVQLSSADSVLAANPVFAPNSQLMLGLVGAYSGGSDAAFEMRAFAPKIGVYEDPVTGSLNASVAQWLFASGQVVGDYRASQGSRLGRTGTISLSQDDSGNVWVGGPSVTCIRGTIRI